MITVLHKFRDYPLQTNAEILVLGTFNPDTLQNEADFFYSRRQNYLWRLLPVALGKQDLKTADVAAKQIFCQQNAVAFADLIGEVIVPQGQEANYSDDFLDDKVSAWADVVVMMAQMPYLRKVAFTRKTFSGVPHIAEKVAQVQTYCLRRGIAFACLPTPTRGYTDAKQQAWTDFLGK